VVSGLFAFEMRFPVLFITASLQIIHTYDMSKFDRILQALIYGSDGEAMWRTSNIFDALD